MSKSVNGNKDMWQTKEIKIKKENDIIVVDCVNSVGYHCNATVKDIEELIKNDCILSNGFNIAIETKYSGTMIEVTQTRHEEFEIDDILKGEFDKHKDYKDFKGYDEFIKKLFENID